MRGFKGPFVIATFALTLLAFQNCTQYSFRSLSSGLKMNSMQADNGVPYDGKPDASFYRFIPEFSCEGQSSVKDRIEVRDGRFHLFENHLQTCATSSRELAAEEVIRSPLQTDSVSFNDFIYTRYENELKNPPDSVEEVLCRDDFTSPRIEIITKYNQSQMTASTKVFSLEASATSVQTFEDPSTLRNYSGAAIEYTAFSGNLGFRVSLDQTIPGGGRRFVGEVTHEQGDWSGKIPGKKLVCITGLYSAPIETLPLSLASSIRGPDSFVLSSVVDHNGALMAASVIAPYSGEVPFSPFLSLVSPKPSLIGIYQSLDNGNSWSPLAKVQSAPGKNSVEPKLLSIGTSVFLYGTDGLGEIFVSESNDQGITWQTRMRYRPTGFTSIAASGAVLSSDNHLLISGYGRSSTERKSFVRKCNLQTWICSNPYENTTVSGTNSQIGTNNLITQIWRDALGTLYTSHRYGPTQSADSTYVKKSTDNGGTWTDLVQDSTSSTNINALAVSADGQMILYGGARGASTPYLQQSTDGGQTWISTTNVCAGWSVTSIIILANKDAILSCYDYARLSPGIHTALVYKKSATQTRWTELFRISGGTNGRLYLRPNGEIYYFEANFSSLQASANSGNSWTSRTYPIGKIPSLGDAQFLSVLETNLGDLFAVGYVTIAPAIKNAVIYKSVDKGISWSLDYSFGTGNTSFGSIAKSSISNTMIAGGSQNLNVWVAHKYNALTSTWIPSDLYAPTNGVLASLNQVVSGGSGRFWAVGSILESPTWAKRWTVRGSTDEGNSWSTLDGFQLNAGYSSEAIGGAALGSDLYVAGYGSDTSGVGHWLVRMYAAGGTISTDDENGFANGSASMARGILAASDGSLYAVGEYSLILGVKHWVVKKKPMGGQWSVVDDYRLDLGGDAIAYSVSEDSSQRIVVTGSAKDSNGRQFAVVRVLTSSGWETLDSYRQHSSTVATGSSACSTSKVCTVGSYLDSDGMYRGYFRSLPDETSP